MSLFILSIFLKLMIIVIQLIIAVAGQKKELEAGRKELSDFRASVTD